MQWVRAMSVPFLVERHLVQPHLAQLHQPGLAAQFRRLRGLQLQVNPHRQCVV